MRTVDVAITGYGRIGLEIAGMLHARSTAYRARHGVEVRITGVCGSAAGSSIPRASRPNGSPAAAASCRASPAAPSWRPSAPTC